MRLNLTLRSYKFKPHYKTAHNFIVFEIGNGRQIVTLYPFIFQLFFGGFGR